MKQFQFFQLSLTLEALLKMSIERCPFFCCQFIVQQKMQPFFVLVVVHLFTCTLLIHCFQSRTQVLRSEEEIPFHRAFRTLHHQGDLSQFVSFIMFESEHESLFW